MGLLQAAPAFAQVPNEEANCLAEQQAPAAIDDGQTLGRLTGLNASENPGLIGAALASFVPSDCFTR